MAFKDIRFSHSEQEFSSLSAWAKKLSIPVKALLHHGAQGDLLLFTMPPAHVDYYSVHEIFVGELMPLPYEAMPISMPEKGVMGLVLSTTDCAQLAAGQSIEKKFFGAIIRKHGAWANVIDPITGRLGSTLPPDGWRIAAYKKPSSSQEENWSIHWPLPVKIRAVNVYIRDVDIEVFIARLKTFQFISDIFNGERITEELPAYASGKLNELIAANRLFWRNYQNIARDEKERRRVEVGEFLEENFGPLFDKKSNPKALIAFAAEICDPTLVPPSQQLPATSATPGILALLTAAKLFWSAHCTCPRGYETYPSRDAVVDFLRFMGLREANAASSGATLIRPEGIETPEPRSNWLDTLRQGRQALRR